MAGYIERRALNWVNDYRVKQGAQPLVRLPRGVRRDPNGCVINRALKDVHPNNSIGHSHLHTGARLDDRGFRFVKGDSIKMPWFISLMIITFDMRLRPAQNALTHGYDKREFKTTESKEILTIGEKFAMWQDRRRIAKEMRAEQEKARLERLAATLAAQGLWKAKYTDIWMAECLKQDETVITDELQAIYEMEPYQKEEELIPVA